MNQNIEAELPLLPVVAGFVFLLIAGSFLNKRLREKELARQGQIFAEGGRALPIEHRLAANKVWASGSIPCNGSTLMIVLWLVAIVWNLTFGVSFYKSFSNLEMPTGGKVMLGIFALLGAVALVFAVRETIRRHRYGKSVCSIFGKAGILGKEMTGQIRTENEIPATGDYTILIECLESYSVGSGKNRRTEIKTHYQDKQKVPAPGKSSRAGIPFKFLLPEYPPETGYQMARGKINWQIRMEAPVQGVDYSAIFVVPVFKMD